MKIDEKACPVHPTPVSGKDVTAAEAAYRDVIREIYCAVIGQVLKANLDDYEVALLFG
jgi:hypothetical protein